MNVENAMPPGVTNTVTPAGSSTVTAPAIALPEDALMRLPGAHELFGNRHPALRQADRLRFADELAGYLASGFISEAHTGPVQRLIETASNPDGVAFGETNLQLDRHALVFGSVNQQGVGIGYYVCRRGGDANEYFLVGIESGDGCVAPYDIFVSEAWDWASFTAQLPRV